MGQQEYDNFKRLIREWLDSHPDEYATFVEEMNDKEFKGFVKVFKVATTLVPRYKEATRRRIGDDKISDFEELENVLLDSDLAQKIVNEFHHSKRRSIIPAMLAWLYYGRSYECMVEQGEELAKRKGITGLYKWLVSYMVRFIIKKSISSGMRTKRTGWLSGSSRKPLRKTTSWNGLLRMKKTLKKPKRKIRTAYSKDSPRVPDEKRHTHPAGAADREQGCHYGKNGTRLKTHTTETDIARLYIALVEYRFMRPCPIKTFRNALQQQYIDLSIVHERGIQKAYRNLTTPFGGSKKLIKDIGEDHVAIEELKAYLSA